MKTQSGFMQKRHITNNIRLVLDVLDYSDLIDSDGFIFFLDYYKAFDTMEHEILFQALRKIGFGDAFCRMVQMLYINGNSSIKLSNGTSPRFFLKRGVRQGCPVSPYLFLSATHFLSTHINNSQLKGITIGNTKIKISQLADDTALFLNDSSQIKLALGILFFRSILFFLYFFLFVLWLILCDVCLYFCMFLFSALIKKKTLSQ